MFVQQLLCYCKLGQCCEPAGVNKASPTTPLHRKEQDNYRKLASVPAGPAPGSKFSQSNIKPTSESPCGAAVGSRVHASRRLTLEWAQETRPVRLWHFLSRRTRLMFLCVVKSRPAASDPAHMLSDSRSQHLGAAT